MLATLGQDLRLAARGLRRSPGFAAVTFATLALGIGATSAMFSVFNAVLLKPLPWREPDRAVMIWSRWNAFDKTWVAAGEVLDYRRRTTTLQGVGAWAAGEINVTGGGAPERVGVAQVTANLFDVLGTRPASGRPFTPEEDTPGAARAAIISHELWQRRYGGNPLALGQGIQLNGLGYRIVGIMPRGFCLPTDYTATERTQVWVPLQIDPRTADHGSHGLYAAARLKPGVTVSLATNELGAIARALTREGFYPEAMQFTAFAVSLRDEVTGEVRPAIVSVFGAVGCLLLIACANVANLMLVRAEARQREVAVRAALGATRRRTIRQLLTEGLLLSVLSGGFGLLLAVAGVRWLAWWNPAGIPRLSEAQVDIPAAAFTFAVAVGVAVLFSVVPALRLARTDVIEHLRDGSQNATAGTARQRFRSTLIVVETALAAALLIGAGLMVRSLAELQRIDLGFNPSGVLTLRLAVPAASYETPEAAVGFYRNVLDRVRGLPGVRNAAAVRLLPLASTIGDFGLTIEGYDPPPGHNPKGDWQIATDGYLETVGEQLVRGRGIRATDDERGMLVGLINEEMAKAYWPGADPIGRRFRIGRNPTRPWVTVVGIVRNVRHNGVAAIVKEKFYIPHAQWHRSVGPMRSMYLVVKGNDGDVDRLAASVSAAVRETDPNVPVAGVRSMDEVVAAALSQPRFTGALFSLFSGLAVLLAAVGIYGVLSCLVSQRRREIGIRLAIGASPSVVARQLLGRGVLLSGLGVASGALGALALAPWFAGLLYRVAPSDPLSFTVGVAGLLAVAAAASYFPARRATQVDPALVLKAE